MSSQFAERRRVSPETVRMTLACSPASACMLEDDASEPDAPSTDCLRFEAVPDALSLRHRIRPPANSPVSFDTLTRPLRECDRLPNQNSQLRLHHQATITSATKRRCLDSEQPRFIRISIALKLTAAADKLKSARAGTTITARLRERPTIGQVCGNPLYKVRRIPRYKAEN